MATFLVQQQELADRLNLDQTVSANATKLQRWLNLIQQDISSRADWTFLQEREIVQTVTQKTAGTVNVTNGSGTVTGTSTSFASTDVRAYFQVSGDTNWYEITAQASATSITITPTYGGTTATGKNYTIRRVFYNLSNSVDRIITVRQATTPIKLTYLGTRTLDLFQPDITTVSPPRGYILFRRDPADAATDTKNYQISFFPIPDAVMNIEVRFIKILSDLSANGDISQIPVKWHNVNIDGAEWLGRKHLNDPGEGIAKQQYEFGIQKMIEDESALDDWHPILQSRDDIRTSRFIPFPTQFEQPL